MRNTSENDLKLANTIIVGSYTLLLDKEKIFNNVTVIIHVFVQLL